MIKSLVFSRILLLQLLEKIDLIKHTMGKISIPQRAGAGRSNIHLQNSTCFETLVIYVFLESIFRAIDKCNFRVGDEIENNSKIE